MIGVYVGSFNPPHKGHIKITNYLLNKVLDKIIIIPTGNYWNKNNLISLNDRINMLKYYENEKIIIDTENNNYEYTYLILENISKTYKKEDLNLILGADNIINFDKWKNYQELLDYNLIIINRDNIDIDYYLKKLKKIDKYIILNDLPQIEISSTMIRNYIKENNYESLKTLIDENVLQYIKKNNLYKEETYEKF